MDIKRRVVLSIIVGGILTLSCGYYLYLSYCKKVYLGVLLILYSVFVIYVAKLIKRERMSSVPVIFDPIESSIVKKLNKIYRRVEYIDHGGFSYVFKVEDDNGNVYAVKVPVLRDEKDEELFFNEVEKWKKLSHRNIVKMVKTRLNPPHLVLEYVKGKSLKKLLEERGKLDVLEACKIAFDIARALEYAHRERIYHCDLKPSNILIDEGLKEAKLTDFGLAKRRGSEGKGGTLSYLPPEGIDDWTDKSDIYQLGLVLYEMITGKSPNRIINCEPLSNFNPEAEGLDDLIRRCLSKDPRDRPTAREFRRHIYEFVKEKYGVSLKMSRGKDYDRFVKLSVEIALYEVKMAVSSDDIGEVREHLVEALTRLEKAERYATSEVKNEMEKVIHEIKFWIERSAKPSEDLIDRLRYLLRKVEL